MIMLWTRFLTSVLRHRAGSRATLSRLLRRRSASITPAMEGFSCSTHVIAPGSSTSSRAGSAGFSRDWMSILRSPRRTGGRTSGLNWPKDPRRSSSSSTAPARGESARGGMWTAADSATASRPWSCPSRIFAVSRRPEAPPALAVNTWQARPPGPCHRTRTLRRRLCNRTCAESARTCRRAHTSRAIVP